MNESQRALRHRAELLASLPNIGAFQALAVETRSKEERMVEVLRRRLMSGEPLDSLQRQIDYDRGWIDAMRYITNALPAGAARMLEREQKASDEFEPEEDFWSHGTER